MLVRNMPGSGQYEMIEIRMFLLLEPQFQAALEPGSQSHRSAREISKIAHDQLQAQARFPTISTKNNDTGSIVVRSPSALPLMHSCSMDKRVGRCRKGYWG